MGKAAYRAVYTFAPPGEYDGSIRTAALMRSVATVNVAACYAIHTLPFSHVTAVPVKN